MGDFNFRPDEPEYPLLVGPWDDRYGRLTNLEGFADAWVQAGHPENGGHTVFHKSRGRRVDYCFVSASLAGRVRSADVDTEAQGSDHQPVHVEIDFDS